MRVQHSGHPAGRGVDPDQAEQPGQPAPGEFLLGQVPRVDEHDGRRDVEAGAHRPGDVTAAAGVTTVWGGVSVIAATATMTTTRNIANSGKPGGTRMVRSLLTRQWYICRTIGTA